MSAQWYAQTLIKSCLRTVTWKMNERISDRSECNCRGTHNGCIAAVSRDFLCWSVSSAMTTGPSIVRGNTRGRSPLLRTWRYSWKFGQIFKTKNLLSNSNKISYTGKMTMQLYVYEWANLGEWVLTQKEGKRDVRKRARRIQKFSRQQFYWAFAKLELRFFTLLSSHNFWKQTKQ